MAANAEKAGILSSTSPQVQSDLTADLATLILLKHQAYVSVLALQEKNKKTALQQFADYANTLTSPEDLHIARTQAQGLQDKDAAAAAQSILNTVTITPSTQSENETDKKNEGAQSALEALNTAYTTAKAATADAASAYCTFAQQHLNHPTAFDHADQKINEAPLAIQPTLRQTLRKNYPKVVESDRALLIKRAKKHYHTAMEQADAKEKAAKQAYKAFVVSLGSASDIYFAGSLANGTGLLAQVSEDIKTTLKDIPYDTLVDDGTVVSQEQQKTIEQVTKEMNDAYEAAANERNTAASLYKERTGVDIDAAAVTSALSSDTASFLDRFGAYDTYLADKEQQRINQKNAKADYMEFVSRLTSTQEREYAQTLINEAELDKKAKKDIQATFNRVSSSTSSEKKQLTSEEKLNIETATTALIKTYQAAEEAIQKAAARYNALTGEEIVSPDTELEAAEAQRIDNRLWYDVTQWTRYEIIGRLVGVVYVLLCGLSIEASLVGVGAGALYAGLGAFITAAVNMKGFWTNVTNLLIDLFSKAKSKVHTPTPKGGYKALFYLYVALLGLAYALLNTAMTLSDVRETFGVQGDGFWNTFYIPVIFGGTFVVLWGLFVQEQRKWLSYTVNEEGIEESPLVRLKRTTRRLFGMENDPNLYTDAEQQAFATAKSANQKPPVISISPAAVLARFMTAVALTGLLAYGGYVVADIVGEMLTQGISDFLRNADVTGTFTKEGAGTGSAGNNLLGSFSSTFAYLFIAAATIYGLGLAKRLADVAVRYFREDHDYSPSGIWNAIKNKEKECWKDAVQYAHKERIKGSVIPFHLNIILNFLYQHLTLAVFCNAANNAALFVNTKLESMSNAKGDDDDRGLTDKNIGKITGLALSTFTRSAGFGAIATLEKTCLMSKTPAATSSSTSTAKHKQWNPSVSMRAGM